MNSQMRWFMQLSDCYRKGWKAAEQGQDESDCPYSPAGVGKQRCEFWLRGFRRQKNGQPFNDLNG